MVCVLNVASESLDCRVKSAWNKSPFVNRVLDCPAGPVRRADSASEASGMALLNEDLKVRLSWLDSYY